VPLKILDSSGYFMCHQVERSEILRSAPRSAFVCFV